MYNNIYYGFEFFNKSYRTAVAMAAMTLRASQVTSSVNRLKKHIIKNTSQKYKDRNNSPSK